MVSSHTTQWHQYNLGKSTTSVRLGAECIHPYFDVLGKLCLSSFCIGSSSSVKVSSGICHRSIQTLDSNGTMLGAGFLASHSSQHVGRCSLALRRSYCGCFGRQGPQGSAICAFNSLAAQTCVVQTRVLFLSLSGDGGGTSSIYNEGLPAMLEGMGRLVCSRQCTISASKLVEFLVHLFRVGLALHKIHIYHSTISTFLEHLCYHKASNHPIISKLMHCFYLKYLHSHKCFDPWDVKHLLSLLESWLPASSLTNFKLAWKTAILFSTCYCKALF